MNKYTREWLYLFKISLCHPMELHRLLCHEFTENSSFQNFQLKENIFFHMYKVKSVILNVFPKALLTLNPVWKLALCPLEKTL